MIDNIVKSAIASLLSGGLFYLVSAYLLDKILNKKISNIIGYCLGATLNFILQYNIFIKSKLLSKSISKYIIKYIILVIVEFFINLASVSYLLDNKYRFIKHIPNKLKKYYPTIIRSLTETFIFLCISYPLRLKWIFK
jgi:hypothetical protein